MAAARSRVIVASCAATRPAEASTLEDGFALLVVLAHLGGIEVHPPDIRSAHDAVRVGDDVHASHWRAAMGNGGGGRAACVRRGTTLGFYALSVRSSSGPRRVLCVAEKR